MSNKIFTSQTSKTLIDRTFREVVEGNTNQINNKLSMSAWKKIIRGDWLGW